MGRGIVTYLFHSAASRNLDNKVQTSAVCQFANLVWPVSLSLAVDYVVSPEIPQCRDLLV